MQLDRHSMKSYPQTHRFKPSSPPEPLEVQRLRVSCVTRRSSWMPFNILNLRLSYFGEEFLFVAGARASS